LQTEKHEDNNKTTLFGVTKFKL